MPVSVDEFVRLVETAAPRELAYDWDNSGLLLRCGDTVSKVLVALDATMAVAEEARQKGYDMLLVHHPLIFSPLKALNDEAGADAVLMALIRAGISLYAAHTPFDRAAGGIGDALAQTLGLERVRTADGAGESLMRVGELKEAMPPDAFVAHVKAALCTGAVRLSAMKPARSISCVAVVGGSGGDFVAAANQEGAQALVTGEAKHHHFIEAAARGLLLVEAGHYQTECAFAGRITMSLQARLNEVQCDLGLEKAENDKAPYAFG